MKPAEPIPLPGFAHVPGKTPRHDAAVFGMFHDSVRPGMGLDELERSLAWRAGWVFLEQGYFWEAHEVLEPVWMALPEGSEERDFVQGVIQLANAELKARMGRPKAVLRLCDIAQGLLNRSAQGCVMGLSRAVLIDRIERLRAAHRRESG